MDWLHHFIDRHKRDVQPGYLNKVMSLAQSSCPVGTLNMNNIEPVVLAEHFLRCVPENTGLSGIRGHSEFVISSGLELGICMLVLFGSLIQHSSEEVLIFPVAETPASVHSGKSLTFPLHRTLHTGIGQMLQIALSSGGNLFSTWYFPKYNCNFNQAPWCKPLNPLSREAEAGSSLWILGKPVENKASEF